MENENIELTEMEPSARRSTGPHRCHHHHLSSNDVYFSSHRPKPTTQCLSATTVATGSMQVMDPLERHTRFGIQSPLPPATPQVSRHYRLTKTSTTSNNHWEAVIDLMSQSILNRFILTYVHWTFQTSIVWVLASLTVVFWAIIILYAVCIWAVGMTHPECIYVKDLDFKEAGNYFMDALTISWTTFSSVVRSKNGTMCVFRCRCMCSLNGIGFLFVHHTPLSIC